MTFLSIHTMEGDPDDLLVRKRRHMDPAMERLAPGFGAIASVTSKPPAASSPSTCGRPAIEPPPSARTRKPCTPSASPACPCRPPSSASPEHHAWLVFAAQVSGTRCMDRSSPLRIALCSCRLIAPDVLKSRDHRRQQDV